MNIDELIDENFYDIDEEYWTDKYGNEHFIPEMSTSYILNCISFIKKYDEDLYSSYLDYLPIFEMELEKRKNNK